MSEIRNLHPDPRCLRVRDTWNAAMQQVGEKYRYELTDGKQAGSVACWSPLFNQDFSGKILYARITSDINTVFDNLSIEFATTIAKEGTWIASRVGGNDTRNHAIFVTSGPFVLQEVGCYTPDDWEQLYALYQKGDITYPWVAGPRNATAAGEKGPWEL